jgi:pyruvate formate lyase activating enzyme
MLMAPQGVVFDIKRYALHDGPGIRTTVFLKGCPLACAWCHNPEGLRCSPEVVYRHDRCLGCGACVSLCHRSALTLTAAGVLRDAERCLGCGSCASACPALARERVGRSFSVSQVVAEVLKDQLFYDESGGGVTFSGGEPLSQPDFLLALLEACGGHAIHRCVDTSGYAPWEILSSVAAHTDLFLYDLKHVDNQAHKSATGVGSDRILDNLRRLGELGAAVIVRYPLIPGFNDDAATIGRVCDLVATLPGTMARLHLLPYHDFQMAKYRRFGRPYAGHTIASEPTRPVAEVAQQIRAAGLTVKIGG